MGLGDKQQQNYNYYDTYKDRGPNWDERMFSETNLLTCMDLVRYVTCLQAR